MRDWLEDYEAVMAALIDAQPGPMHEHDPMCGSLFALSGKCNCSVARNLEAREALARLRAVVEGRA